MNFRHQKKPGHCHLNGWILTCGTGENLEVPSEDSRERKSKCFDDTSRVP
jgi:hypothetical protein